MKSVLPFFYAACGFALTTGIVALNFAITHKRFSLYQLTLIFFGLEALAINIQTTNGTTFSAFLEYIFYGLTIGCTVETIFLNKKISIAFWILTLFSVSISLIIRNYNPTLNYELPLTINYILILSITIYNHFLKRLSESKIISEYALLLGFFTYNTISSIFYSLKELEYPNAIIYMKANFIALIFCSTLWLIGLFLKEFGNTDQE